MIKYLNVRPETVKLLEENVGKPLQDINEGDDFLDKTPKAEEIKTKLDKWDHNKLRCFCTAKEIIDSEQRHPTEWRKKPLKSLTKNSHLEYIRNSKN